MSIQNWKIKKVKLMDLKLNPNNARSISQNAMNGLTNSLSRFGYVEPIVWNERTAHIVGGHQRYAVLLENGVKEAMVVVVDMSEEDELAANITLNNPEVEGKWTEQANDILEHLRIDNMELFESLNMDSLLASLEKAKRSGGDDCDTECPCCGHRWKIESEDILVKD